MALNLQRQEENQEELTAYILENAVQNNDFASAVDKTTLLQQPTKGDLVRLNKLTAKNRQLHQRFWEEYSYVQ